jgi:hypothetical protein
MAAPVPPQQDCEVAIIPRYAKMDCFLETYLGLEHTATEICLEPSPLRAGSSHKRFDDDPPDFGHMRHLRYMGMT